MIYDLLDPDPHALLSEKSLELAADVPKFEAQGEVAEMLLGLNRIAEITGDDLPTVLMFIALQINWQMELGIDPLYQKSAYSRHTEQTIIYRDNINIHPWIRGQIDTFLRKFRFRRVLRSMRG